MNRRYVVRINAECGNPIVEIRDLALDPGSTLIAEIYPHGWLNPRYEAERICARLNGERDPTPEQFAADRMEEFATRLTILERLEKRIEDLEARRRRKKKIAPGNSSELPGGYSER